MNKMIKRGFTLVELLFVMAIIAILAGFAIANLKDSTKVAQENSLKNDVKNIIAQQNTYFAAHQNYFSCDLTFDENGKSQCSDEVTNENIPNLYVFASKPYDEKWLGIWQETCSDGTLGFHIRLNDNTSNKSVSYDSCSDGTIQLLNDTGC